MWRSFATAVVCLIYCLPAQATEFGQREDAIAMVERAKASFKKNGAAATFKAITERSDGFHDRDLYAFVYDMKGKVVAHGGDARLVGQGRLDLHDENGKPIVSEMIKTAQRYGKGWVDYCWPNPVSVEDMTSFVERLDANYVVGVPVLRQDLSFVQALESRSQ
jgi:cytochrome c